MEWPEGTLPWRFPSRSATRRRERLRRSGRGVGGLEIGEPVVVCAPWGCGMCRNCRAGRREPLRRAARASRRRDRPRRRPGRVPARAVPTAARPERRARPRRCGAADRRRADALPRDQGEPAAPHAGVDDRRDRSRRARSPGSPDPAGAHTDADRCHRRPRVGRRARPRGAARTKRSTRAASTPPTSSAEHRSLRGGARPRLRRHRRDVRLATSVLGSGGRLTLIGHGGGTFPWPSESLPLERSVKPELEGTVPELQEVVELARTGVTSRRGGASSRSRR